jgi:hypothetical protein
LSPIFILITLGQEGKSSKTKIGLCLAEKYSPICPLLIIYKPVGSNVEKRDKLKKV